MYRACDKIECVCVHEERMEVRTRLSQRPKNFNCSPRCDTEMTTTNAYTFLDLLAAEPNKININKSNL